MFRKDTTGSPWNDISEERTQKFHTDDVSLLRSEMNFNEQEPMKWNDL